MIKVENLSFSFPQKDLYNKISFHLEAGQHCAFIGTSGSGKSTLLDMIMDFEKYSYTLDGKLLVSPDCRMGFVSQFSKINPTDGVTVFEYIAERFLQIQQELNDICSEMESASDLDELLERYQVTLDLFQSMDGDNFESNITKKLNLADLGKHENLEVAKLSGGEFKLVQVIREMLNSPELLIMDEPDAFLDFENLNSLRNLINGHKGTLLVITHNRYLLNHCFNKIIHLENTELQEFEGRYIDYNFTLLQTKIELQEIAIAEAAEIERVENMIDQLRAIATHHSEAARGKSLNARVKILERLEARRIKAPFVTIKQPEIPLKTDNVIDADSILSLENYSVGYEEPLLEEISFQISPTDKVALIGANGTGKTTMLREIFQNNHPSIKVHPDIEMSYLSQIQGEILSENNTVLDEFLDAGFDTQRQVKSYLSQFDFDTDILSQKIASLSGGEKNILQLAKIATTNANLLLLDEPTSHLDTYSQIALEKAIENYNGAVIMISHDFYSIVNSMDYVLIIEDKSIRKVSMRKFRKMIYAKHFDKDYLELEQKKKDVESKIAFSLQEDDFLRAKSLSEDLETLLKQM